MRYQGVLMECALYLSRRSVHGSLAMGSRPKAGPGQESAKVILRAPVSWAYAKAGRRLDVTQQAAVAEAKTPGSGVAWASGQMSGPVYNVLSPGCIAASFVYSPILLPQTTLAA